MQFAKQRTLIAVGFCIAISVQCRAQDQFPPKFAGLLKAGSYVRVKSVASDTSEVQLMVYSDKQAAIAKDSLAMSIDELRKKYPEVEKLVEETLEAEISDPQNEYELADMRVSLIRLSGKWGTIKHVGDDYVAVYLKSSIYLTEAIPFKHISKIGLGLPGVQLSVSKSSRRDARPGRDNPFGEIEQRAFGR